MAYFVLGQYLEEMRSLQPCHSGGKEELEGARPCEFSSLQKGFHRILCISSKFLDRKTTLHNILASLPDPVIGTDVIQGQTLRKSSIFTGPSLKDFQGSPSKVASNGSTSQWSSPSRAYPLPHTHVYGVPNHYQDEEQLSDVLSENLG